MADQVNMAGLSLKDSQHAPPADHQGPQSNGFGERSAYIPPHMRQRGGGPPQQGPNGFDGGPAPVPNGTNNSAWPAPSQANPPDE